MLRSAAEPPSPRRPSFLAPRLGLGGAFRLATSAACLRPPVERDDDTAGDDDSAPATGDDATPVEDDDATAPADDDATPVGDDDATPPDDDPPPPPVDADGDGASDSVDCDPSDSTVHPGAAGSCRGVDQDGDVAVDQVPDADFDGFTTCAGDCGDTRSWVNPDAGEDSDLLGNDRDGCVDEGFDVDPDSGRALFAAARARHGRRQRGRSWRRAWVTPVDDRIGRATRPPAARTGRGRREVRNPSPKAE